MQFPHKFGSRMQYLFPYTQVFTIEPHNDQKGPFPTADKIALNYKAHMRSSAYPCLSASLESILAAAG